jgi:hypothetical protein
VEGLCAHHDGVDTFYGLMMILSVIAWPATVSLNVIGYTIIRIASAIYHSFKWLWGIPGRALNREWEKIDRLVELLHKKYRADVTISVRESDQKKGVLTFNVTHRNYPYEAIIVAGAFSREKGFVVHPFIIKESHEQDVHIDVQGSAEFFPEVQGIYYKIVELIKTERPNS